MKNSVELLDEKAQLKDKAFKMIDTCVTEIRNFTDQEKEEYESIKTKINDINEELRKLDETYNTNTNKEENKSKKIMEKNFSLLKAIRSIANNQKMDSLTEAVVKAGSEEMRKAGLNYTGQIQLPSIENRTALTVADEGEDVVATNLMDVITPLHSKNVLAQAGAKFVTGLVGDVQYPVMTAMNTSWASETGTASETKPTYTNVKLTPHRLTCIVPISKQFIIQDSVGAENAIREEIINAINAKLEATALGNGAGSADEPKGLFPSEGDSGLDSVTTFANVCELESDLEEANVYGDLKYIVSPKAKADLRGMAKGSKSTQLVYENGEIDGTPALCTSHLSDKHIVYGDFGQYVVASWGNIDITVDNFTLAGDGQIRLVVNSYWDLKPLRTEALKVAKVGA